MKILDVEQGGVFRKVTSVFKRPDVMRVQQYLDSKESIGFIKGYTFGTYEMFNNPTIVVHGITMRTWKRVLEPEIDILLDRTFFVEPKDDNNIFLILMSTMMEARE